MLRRSIELNRNLLYLQLWHRSTTKPLFSLMFLTRNPKRSTIHTTDHQAPFPYLKLHPSLT